MKLNSMLLGGVAAAMLMATAAQADTTLVNNNFEGANATQYFSGTGGYTPTIVTAPNGSTKFLGNLSTGQTTAVLTLDTTGYSSLTISYNLYAILSQDGNAGQSAGGGAGGGNGDFFNFAVNGNQVYDYTFANYPGNTQSYCPAPASSPCAPQTGAINVDGLGYAATQGGNEGFGDATYKFSYTFAPTGNSTTFSFTSLDNEGVANEFYGIDNVLVTGVPAVMPPPPTVSGAPEPGSWALLLGGVAILGGLLRAGEAFRREREADAAAV